MKRKITLIISIILVIIVISTTYAWHKWTSNNLNVSYDIDGFNIIYDGGPDISNVKLIPVSSKEKGEADGTGIAKVITASSSSKTASFSLNLNLEVFPEGMKHQSLVWEIYGNDVLLNSGNFGNVNQGDTITLLNDYVLTSKTSSFKLYIWYDGLQNNPVSILDKHYKFVLNANASNQVPTLLSDRVISLTYGCTSYESGFSGVCATNAYQVNGETKYHEYRYIGGEVNNYVLFNNDLYQIIGVFDDYSHGVTGEQLVKLIAARKLTAVAWGTYNSSPTYTTYSEFKNDWTGNTTGVPASANILLNEFFLNPTVTSTYGECINWTYGSNNNTYKSKNCTKIKGYGIQSNELRNYIQPVTWYLYGYTSAELSKVDWYQCERNNYSGCTSANSGTYSGTTTASIGLMYASDYMYASGYVASNDTSTTGSSSNYINLNWLYNGLEWTIVPNSKRGNTAFGVYNTGVVHYSSTCHGRGIRPTFYLKSTVKIKSGDGTFENPYTIG